MTCERSPRGRAKPHTRISREVEFSLKKNYSKRTETAFSRKVPFQQFPRSSLQREDAVGRVVRRFVTNETKRV